jgi:hypothetical protein
MRLMYILLQLPNGADVISMRPRDGIELDIVYHVELPKGIRV